MYSIADYDNRYKPVNKSGGELIHADYVKLPVNPKGDGLQVLLENKRGLEVFAVWCLLLEKTTDQKPEMRGKLLNFKDEPASIAELAKSISLKGKEKLVEYSISILVSMGWIISDGDAEISSEEFRKRPPKLSKGKLIKDKYSDSFIDFWKAFKGRWNVDKGRRDKGGKMEAFEEWQKLNNQQQAKAMKAAPLTGSKITKDACRWLKYHRWEDFESDVTPEQHTTKDQQALEKKKHTIRSEYSDYYRSQTTEHLQEMSKANALITHRWLIKEILAKKG